MRIAVDARVLGLPEQRGIGSYLCEVLAAWPEPADTFTLISPRPIPPERLRCPAGLDVLVVPEPRGSRFRVWDWWTLPRAVRGTRPDMLWSPANQAAPVDRLPQVVTIHDTLLQELVDHGSLLERVFHGTISPAWVRRYATRVATVSRFSKERVQAVFAVDTDRVRVIPNGASLPARPFRDKAQAREYLRTRSGQGRGAQEHGPDHPSGYGRFDRPYVLSLGAESPWKNTEGVLRAFALVGRDAPGVDFVLAGVQERAREGFAALGRKLGLNGRLMMFGFVDRLERDALYQGAELFVYPSLFEGFGLPPLEAMALDTPVVASNAASIPEVVGRAAVLADAGDAPSLAGSILHVLASPGVRSTLVAAGRKNIARFTWAEAAAAHRKLFLEGLVS